MPNGPECTVCGEQIPYCYSDCVYCGKPYCTNHLEVLTPRICCDCAKKLQENPDLKPLSGQ